MVEVQRIRERVPTCLQRLDQWVCWMYVQRDGKATKAPIDPHTGSYADASDADTWASLDDALAACSRFSAVEGVGFVFTADDAFCGVDLDDCIDADTGALKPWGARIVAELNSYTEISPSGRGVKSFVRARKTWRRCKARYEDGDVEMYDQRRFFTVTGERVNDVETDVRACQQEIDALYDEVFGPPSVPSSKPPQLPPETTGSPVLADEQIIALAGDPKRKNGAGAKFAALFEGRWEEHFASPSEADSSLCWTLAYYTKDAAQIDRIFRASQLMRAKWDEARPGGTYGSETIAKALTGVTAHYRPPTRLSKRSSDDGEPPENLPPLYRPDEVARLYVQTNARLLYWRGVFHLHTGTCYRPLNETELGARLARFITDVGWWTRPAKKDRNGNYEDGAVEHPDYGDMMVMLTKIVPRTGDVREILLQLKTDYLPDVTDAPTWMSNFTRPRAADLVACRNGLLHLPTGDVHGHSDELFNLNAVGYDYEPDAPPPCEWLNFLGDVFEHDPACIDTLQEMFGYYLLPDTSQQKIGLIVGPKRSGKGTIARVLTGVLGQANVAGPTLSSLASQFGLWPLLDKPLAIISDARLSGRTDQAVVIERCLSISGEDIITADRKHLPSWTGKMITRLLMLTNELPKLTDASGALAGRFIMLTMNKSFYGREDHGLTDRLLGELPGILNWAIDGWVRLNERGHFVQPAGSEVAMQELEDLSSPIHAFLRERCLTGPNHSVPMDELYIEWHHFCRCIGRTHAGTKQTFGRDLKAALPTLGRAQPRETDGTRPRVYTGVTLDPEKRRTPPKRREDAGTQSERGGTQPERDWHAERECVMA